MFQCRKRRLALLVSKIVFTFSFIPIIWFIVNTNTRHTTPELLVKSNENIHTKLDRNSPYNAGSVIKSGWTENFDANFEKKTKHSVIDVKAEMEKLNREKVHADDPRLVHIIRNHFILPPSKMPYDLRNADKLDTSMGQAPFVDNRLGFKEGGFFVESGAHDGEFLSNTLFLERTRHWTGILIEPLPKIFKKLQKKHRKAYSLNACLSPHPYPSKEELSDIPVVGSIMKTNSSLKDPHVKTVHVQCFPLYSVLLALNRTNVDFLSLDVEGVEHSVLETIPWNKVNITMLAIEYDKWIGRKSALCVYMERRGYDCALNLLARGAADSLFIKRK